MTEDEGLREIGSAVEEAKKLLLEPSTESLDRSCVLLEQACARLGEWKNAHQGKVSSNGGARAMLSGIRQAIARVAALLENAAAFRIGLSQELAVAAGGYTATGEPAAPSRRQGTLSIEG